MLDKLLGAINIIFYEYRLP